VGLSIGMMVVGRMEIGTEALGMGAFGLEAFGIEAFGRMALGMEGGGKRDTRLNLCSLTHHQLTTKPSKTMRQYVELIEEIDRSVNGRHVIAAMFAELHEDDMTDEQVFAMIESLPTEAFEEFIHHFKETLHANNRSMRRRWQKLADKWLKEKGL